MLDLVELGANWLIYGGRRQRFSLFLTISKDTWPCSVWIFRVVSLDRVKWLEIIDTINFCDYIFIYVTTKFNNSRKAGERLDCRPRTFMIVWLRNDVDLWLFALLDLTEINLDRVKEQFCWAFRCLCPSKIGLTLIHWPPYRDREICLPIWAPQNYSIYPCVYFRL